MKNKLKIPKGYKMIGTGQKINKDCIFCYKDDTSFGWRFFIDSFDGNRRLLPYNVATIVWAKKIS